ncbi:hypothetical protein KKJ09_17510 [Xenorhabdus bovienii]|uniref:hypothetical protein n=1 Tax=Xenorhabdus bovienii TaxID=40576 RepID=UPI0023B31DE2|nr:hypothetical protein [Xenorhabdus bovienii]MDE9495327.1 hypothetical protein [Xenorhabdus bovienii]MDE9503722.1 hypothetical protein [Xenorhabdus bovienii]MDE9527431.1 hypothetical protein [Xenorhabdus bovienii]MDE9570568.1 hypothetical protein [Xenorhabdus bovienii]
MNQREDNVSILAGNSRVYYNDDGEIVVEAQLKAFEAALLFAKRRQEKSGQLPKISVAFDHRGIFRLQFLSENLTNSQKRNPRLSQLHTSIVNVFQSIAEKHQIPLSEIYVIHEDSARQHIVHTLSLKEIPENVKQRMVSKTLADSKPQTSDALYEEPTQKLTCAAITKEYFERAADDFQDTDAILEVFFEDCEWSRSLAYVRGIQLSHMLGVSTSIRLNLVSAAGGVSQGDIVSA